MQILASVAFMAGRPGVVFAPVIPKRREADQTETRFDSADSSESHVQPMTLKPRFGCQFYTEVGSGADRALCDGWPTVLDTINRFYYSTSPSRGEEEDDCGQSLLKILH